MSFYLENLLIIIIYCNDKVIVSRDVVFYEQNFPFWDKTQGDIKEDDVVVPFPIVPIDTDIDPENEINIQSESSSYKQNQETCTRHSMRERKNQLG